MLTCVGWQVTLCDPIWQVTLRSCEMVFHEQLYQLFYGTVSPMVHALLSVTAAEVVVIKGI